MKTSILYRLVLVTALTSMLFACKKTDVKDSSSTMSDADLQTQSDDQTRVSNETDAAFDDITVVMNDQATVTGSSDAPAIRYGVATQGVDTVKKPLVCDAVVTIDTSSSTHKLSIIYNGGGCKLTRKRTGTVSISIPAGVRWKDKGAQVTVTFDLTVTRLIDNKSIKLTGTHVYTNVTGGSIVNLGVNNPGPIVHTVSSDNMVITFDNGTQRTWHVARQRSYSYSGGWVVALTGTHTEGSVTGISDWGTNRFGNSFTTSIKDPLVVKQSCGFALTSGSASLVNAAGTTTITFGLDANGAATTGCPVLLYYKLVFTGNGGKSYTFILPY